MLLRLCVVLVMLLPSVAHAVTLMSEDFEGACATVGARWPAKSYSGFPCTGQMTINTDSTYVRSGSQSLKMTYDEGFYSGQPEPGGFVDQEWPDRSHTEIWVTFDTFMVSPFYTGGNEAQNVGGSGTKGLYTFMYSPTADRWWGWVPHWLWGGKQYTMGMQGCYQNNNNIPYDSTYYYHNVQPVEQPDGQWVRHEAHYKLNTPGQADGLYEEYTTVGAGPRVLTTQYANRQCLDATPSGQMPSDAKWGMMRIFRQYGKGVMYIDNVTVTTEAVGAGGPPPPPPPPPPTDTEPPSQPTNLSCTPGSTTAACTWTASTDANAPITYALQYRTGSNVFVTGATSTSSGATLSGLTSTQTYDARVLATDPAGNVSVASATASFATVLATARASIATDTFTRGDSADLGTEWDAGYTDHTAYQLVTNAARASTDDSGAVETYNVALDADQWIESTDDFGGCAGSSGCYPGLVVRGSAPATFNGYVCVITDGPSVEIERRDSGVATVIANESTTAWESTDLRRCEVEGSEIRFYRVRGGTSTLLAAATDTTYTTGRVGIFTYTVGTVAGKDILSVEIGGFEVAADPPTITGLTLDATGADLTYGATTPTSIRVITGNNDRGTISSTIEPIASFPAGRYTRTWQDGLSYVCMYPINASGVQNPDLTSYRCGSLVGIVDELDTTPPVISGCTPSATLPHGTTSWEWSCAIDKPATGRWGLSDVAYASLTNAATTAALTISGTVTGLTNGSTTTLYVGAASTDAFGEVHATVSNTAVTIEVAAAPVADTTRPSDVTGLVATNLGQVAELNWDAATDDTAVVGYQVFQSTGACTTYTPAGNPVPTTTTQANLAAATVHCWTVKALDAANNTSLNASNVATMTTSGIIDFERPSQMTGLRIAGQYSASVLLQWNIGTDNAGPPKSVIEQCTVVSGSSCTTFEIAKSEIVDRSLLVRLSPSTTYCWRGKHSDAAGNVSLVYSETVCGTTAEIGFIERPRIPVYTTRQPRVP